MTPEVRYKRLIPVALFITVPVALLLAGVLGPDPLPVHVPLTGPDSLHPLGTDNSGRDILWLLIRSSLVSLALGLGAGLCATAIGAVMGCMAGYFRSPLEDWVMRVADVFLLVPTLPLTIVCSAYLGPGMVHVGLVIILTTWPAAARVIHARVLRLREQPFVIQAGSMGAGGFYIMTRHILPNCGELIMAKASLAIAGAMLAEAGISFLGLGDPMFPSWGSMLHDAFSGAALINGYVWWYLPPVGCVSICVVLFHALGNRFSDSGPQNRQALADTPFFQPGPGDSERFCSDVPLITIRDLNIGFYDATGSIKPVVTGLNLEMRAGEKIAIVGETGSGKSLFLLSILGLQPEGAVVSGCICIRGKHLSAFTPAERRHHQGSFAAYIPQGLGNALNPVQKAWVQVSERARIHQGIDRRQAMVLARNCLRTAGFDDPDRIMNFYPHQLSGGMKQRVLIASALCGNPALILADEPTKGLDPQSIDDMMKIFDRDAFKTVLAVTHDLRFAEVLADRVIVMRAGRVVEDLPAPILFQKPVHPYTRALLAARTPFPRKTPTPIKTRDRNSSPIRLELRKISLSYGARLLPGRWKPGQVTRPVLDHLDLSLESGNIIGITGPSGIGKTTLGFILAGIRRPDHGIVMLNGADLWSGPKALRVSMNRRLQMVFQHPETTFDPRWTILKTLTEPFRIQGMKVGPEIPARWIRDVNLDPSVLGRRPQALSGGELQRIAIARIMILKPAVVVLDEPTAMLDALTQDRIMNLLLSYGQKYGTAFVLVSHDPFWVRRFCHRVYELKNGRLAESG